MGNTSDEKRPAMRTLAEDEPPAAVPLLVVVSGPSFGATIRIDQPVIIGRSSKATMTIEADSVSGMHAKFTTGPSGSVSVEDLGSRNGTFLNGDLVIETTPLDSVNEISFYKGASSATLTICTLEFRTVND